MAIYEVKGLANRMPIHKVRATVANTVPAMPAHRDFQNRMLSAKWERGKGDRRQSPVASKLTIACRRSSVVARDGLAGQSAMAVPVARIPDSTRIGSRSSCGLNPGRSKQREKLPKRSFRRALHRVAIGLRLNIVGVDFDDEQGSVLLLVDQDRWTGVQFLLRRNDSKWELFVQSPYEEHRAHLLRSEKQLRRRFESANLGDIDLRVDIDGVPS